MTVTHYIGFDVHKKKRQLLRERCRRNDRRGRQASSDTRGSAAMGWETHGAVARGDGSDPVQRLDLRYAEALCGGVADGAPGDDESDRGFQEEKRQNRCAQDGRSGAVQSAAGMLCGAGGDAGVATDAALPQRGGGASGADEEQDERPVDGSGRRVQQNSSYTGRNISRNCWAAWKKCRNR